MSKFEMVSEEVKYAAPIVKVVIDPLTKTSTIRYVWSNGEETVHSESQGVVEDES